MPAQKKSKSSSSFEKKFKPRNKVRKPGIHSKNKSSKLKNSRNYKKAYRGQGK